MKDLPIPIPNLKYNIAVAQGDRDKTIAFAVKWHCYTDTPRMSMKEFENAKRRTTKNLYRKNAEPHTCENCRNRQGDPCVNQQLLANQRCMRWRRIVA